MMDGRIIRPLIILPSIILPTLRAFVPLSEIPVLVLGRGMNSFLSREADAVEFI